LLLERVMSQISSVESRRLPTGNHDFEVTQVTLSASSGIGSPYRRKHSSELSFRLWSFIHTLRSSMVMLLCIQAAGFAVMKVDYTLYRSSAKKAVYISWNKSTRITTLLQPFDRLVVAGGKHRPISKICRQSSRTKPVYEK
jgi:hypothetical protein